jgi:CMP-N-acetylneuraminic acid synthetase|tara:strand:+ start:914 stop:1657 length:744 start_codon:yes stop_codon:yes gene_type:complete
MICALMMGRTGSIGFPHKNIKKVLGRRLFEYPLLASKNSQNIDKIFVTTDCPVITRVSKKYGAIHIKRPKRLAHSKALGEEVFQHGYFEVKKILNLNAKNIEFIVLLMANAPTITGKLIDKGINILRRNKNFDSAVTTSIYNMWSPLRARKVDSNNLLKPFVPFKTFGNSKTLNCDRDSQGDVYYADMSVSIVRPRCLEKIKDGLLPQKWMGKKIAPIPSWGGCDVDYEWQLPMVEFWLKKNGYNKF